MAKRTKISKREALKLNDEITCLSCRSCSCPLEEHEIDGGYCLTCKTYWEDYAAMIDEEWVKQEFSYA